MWGGGFVLGLGFFCIPIQFLPGVFSCGREKRWRIGTKARSGLGCVTVPRGGGHRRYSAGRWHSARSPGDKGEKTAPGRVEPRSSPTVTGAALCLSAAGFPMGYAAAAPAYSPSVYPGASPAFQTGTRRERWAGVPAAGRGGGGC